MMFKIRLVILTFLLAAAFAVPAAYSQQTPSLPPYKKEYFDKGLTAAQRQAWDKAFENFRQALGSTPEYAPGYFNIGVVFEKLGAPLEAAASLNAYLALAPNAPNAAAVRQEINNLKKTRAAQIDAIFQSAVDAIPKIPDIPDSRNNLYFALAIHSATAGRIGKAIDLIKSMKRSDGNPIDRVQDLRIPDPWIHYAGAIAGRELDYEIRSSSLPAAARELLNHLEKTFPIPPPIGNRNDSIATTIDGIFKKRSEAIAGIRNYIDKALAVPTGAPSQTPRLPANIVKQVDFANGLISRAWDSSANRINRSSFDLQLQIKTETDPNNNRYFKVVSDFSGPETATVEVLGKLAAKAGAKLFLFELLERGSDAQQYAVRGQEVEEALWKSIQDAKNPDRFAGYLAWFPKGKYAELADLSMKKVLAEAKLAATRPQETVSAEEALRRGREAASIDNYPEKMRWFRFAADHGNAEAQVAVGAMYMGGQGIPKDGKEGLRWYRKAAEQNDPLAAYSIGLLYHRGAAGLPKDSAEATRWYQKASERGQSFEKGARGEYGWRYGFIARNVLRSIAELYQDERNYSAAITWYRKAAEKDSTPAMRRLGEIYEKGLGVNKDVRQARYWYGQAARFDNFDGDIAKEALSRLPR